MAPDIDRESMDRTETTDGDRAPADRSAGIVDWSRRNALKIAGTGAGIATLGGISMVGTGQEEGEAGEDDEGGGGESEPGDSEHFIADLVDPVFGYPLGASETDDVTIAQVVDVILQEGQGDHEDFPQEPDPSAPGETVEVQAEFFFDPVGLHVEPGTLVHFYDVAALHTISAFHEKFSEPGLEIPTRVPADVPGYTSPPLTPQESWVYEFTEKGVYDYFCFPHLGLGMVGRIVVLDPATDDVDSAEFVAPTAGPLFENDEAVLTAPELDPANIVEVGSVAWADLTLDVAETPTETGPSNETGTDTTPANETVIETAPTNETGT